MEGRDFADEAEAKGAEAGREALIKTVADLTGVTVDHYAEVGLLGFALITDAIGGVDVCLKERGVRTDVGCRLPGRLATPQWSAGAELRPATPRLAARRPRPGGATTGGDGSAGPSGDLREDTVQPDPARTAAAGHPALGGAVVGWDIMDFVKQLGNLAGGNVAFATIPVLDEAGWSDDGMQSVVRVDTRQVQEWVAGLLHNQDEGKTEQLTYTPEKTTTDVINDTDINGLAAAVSEVLTAKGFHIGNVGNNETGHVNGSQVQAAKADDMGAKAVAKDLGGLPVIANAAVPPASVRVVLAGDYTGPGSGMGGGSAVTVGASTSGATDSSTPQSTAPPPSPILTAGSDKPECVN